MDSEKNGPNGEQRSSFRAAFLKRKPSRKNKNSGLLLLLLFLLGGGGVALFVMKKAAYNLAGDKRPDRVIDDSSASGLGVAGSPQFPVLDEEPSASDPSLKKALVGAFSGGAKSSRVYPGAGGGVNGGEDEDPAAGEGGGTGAAASGGGPAAHPASKGYASGVKKAGPAAKTSGLAAGPGGLAAVVAVQSSQAQAGAKGKGGKPSVVDALKSAFKANLISARLSSKDAARMWIAKTFDGNRDSPLSLAYSEKMKSKLDRVNPNSIPNYLRQQSLDGTSARSLGVSKVQMPEFDRSGTQEALQADRDYQQKKMTQDIITAMFKPMGPFDAGKRNDAEITAPWA